MTLNNPLSVDNINICSAMQGNRCGHDSKKPRYFIAPDHHKKRLPQLEEAKRRISETYFDPFKYEFGKIYFHRDKKNRRGGYRKMRSEMREPVSCRVGRMILHYVNLAKMQLGFTDVKTGRFVNFGINFIANKTGVSYVQAKRAIKVLENSGYLSVQKNYYQDNSGKYKSLPAVIKIDISLFYDLGLTDLDINKNRLIENKDFINRLSHHKKTEYNNFKRATKKTAKKEMKEIRKHLNLNDILNKKKKGFYINKEEQALLDKEYPGLSRSDNYTPGVNPLSEILKKIKLNTS